MLLFTRYLAALLLPLATLPAQDFTGRVLEDSTGDPVATAEIKIHKPGMRELIADLDTDRSGRFTGSELPAGDYTIDVLKPNFLTTTFPIHLPAHSVQIRLLHYGVMDGRVTNVQGEPVAGIVRAPYGQTIGATRVAVLAKQPASDEFRSIRDMNLDANGHFRFFDLPPGQYRLGMWFYGINEGSGMQLYPNNTDPRTFTVSGGEIYKDLNFLIAPNPAYNISGSIALPEAKQKFALALGLPDQPTLPASIALAEDNGTFHFDKVPAGAYDLFASGPANGYTQFESVLGGQGETMFGRLRVQVAGSDITNLTVPLSPAKTLSVILRGKGGKALPAECPQTASATVSTVDPWGILLRLNLPISAAKEQTFTKLPPGRTRIATNGLGASCFQAEDIVVDLSKELEQPVAVEVVAAGAIRGTIQGDTGPATAWAVMLLDPAIEGANSQLAYPDATGHFAFETLRPGRYRVAVGPAAETRGNRWLKDFSQMKEINVVGGEPAIIELPVPVPQGGAQ